MRISKKNEVYLVLDEMADSSRQELAEFFTFEVPGFKFMPMIGMLYVRLLEISSGHSNPEPPVNPLKFVTTKLMQYITVLPEIVLLSLVLLLRASHS